VPLVYLSSLP